MIPTSEAPLEIQEGRSIGDKRLLVVRAPWRGCENHFRTAQTVLYPTRDVSTPRAEILSNRMQTRGDGRVELDKCVINQTQ